MTAGVDHARALELLPWLVNGSLRPAERDALEQHVRTCLTCRRELKEQQRLQAAIATQPTVLVSPQRAFEQLDRQLDSVESVSATPSRYEAVRPFAIAAAAGVALLAFLIWLVPTPVERSARYTTLATDVRSDDATLDIVFAADTTEPQMRALLAEIGGEIVAGPSNVGRYSVRLADRDTNVAAVLERLASDSRVRLATPALGGAPQ